MEVIGQIVLAIAAFVATYIFGVKRGNRKSQEKYIEELEKYNAKCQEIDEKYDRLASNLSDPNVLSGVFSGKPLQDLQSKTDSKSKDSDN